jgi:hypothetical protein
LISSEVFALPSRIVRELTVAEETSIVTVRPLPIITSSVAVGTWPHDHIPVVLQLPLLVAVHPAAKAGKAGNATKASRTIMIEAISFDVEWLKIGFFMSFLVYDRKSQTESKWKSLPCPCQKSSKKKGTKGG